MTDQGTPPGGRSNFESHSHQALYSMVSGGNPSELTTTGHALQRLREDIDRIASDLKGYVERVEWKGEGSEAFREWGNHTVRESRKLAQHAGTTGEQLTAAGQALSEVQQSMPRPEFVSVEQEAMTTKPLTNPAEEESARGEAIRQMDKLASYYSTAQQSMTQWEEPQFRPPTGFVPDPEPRHGERERPVTDPSPNFDVTTSAGAALGQQGSTGYGASNAQDALSVVSPTPHHGDVTTSINSVAPTAPANSPLLPHSQERVPNGPPSTSSTPGILLPPPPSRAPRSPAEGSIRPVTPPVSPPPGATRDVTSSRPGTKATPSPPRDTGIVGGTPRSLPATPRTPQGTVIGNEHGPGTRAPMMANPGAPAGGPSHPPTNAPHRRLATEPGGPVASPRTSSRSSGDFTPGGSGLVRGTSPATPTTPQRSSSQRPEYLEEDESTWRDPRGRSIIPPVID